MVHVISVILTFHTLEWQKEKEFLKKNCLRQDAADLVNPTPVSGWNGTFEQSNPAFAYPNPNLTSLPLYDNMAKISKLERQLKVVWPEFSWLTELGNEDSRCYQMFAPDLSRLGYDDSGRVYSIICPQQGASSPALGSLNVEITVIGNRGWANEITKEVAADMAGEGKIWFAPSAHENEFVKLIGYFFKAKGFNFPFNKENAIVISTHKPGHPEQPIFPLTKGQTQEFNIPDFAQHKEVSWSVGHLDVQVGKIVTKQNEKEIVKDFNQLIVDVFNMATGNMLKEGNILTWNVWFTAPELVNQTEWKNHAECWRDSIDVDHRSPNGPGSNKRYYDGSPFKPLKEFQKEEEKLGCTKQRKLAQTSANQRKPVKFRLKHIFSIPNYDFTIPPIIFEPNLNSFIFYFFNFFFIDACTRVHENFNSKL